MEIRVLRYFVTVAEEENITRAANLLHITQPTLSRQLKDLETELGQQLFIRNSHSIQLTQEGFTLLRRATDILDLVSKTESEFSSMQEYQGSDIYIGCAESDGMKRFASITKKLRVQYPQLRVNLQSVNGNNAVERLENGLLDFAVVVEGMDLSKYQVIEMPTTDRWGLLMRKDSPLLKKNEIHLDDLKEIPLLVSRQKGPEVMRKWFDKNKGKISVVSTYDLIYNASLFVKEGLGYALCFDKLVNTSNDILTFRPLVPEITSHMYVIYKSEQNLSRSAKIFLDALKNEAQHEC